MDVFLTSSIGCNKEIRGEKVPCRFDNRNRFVDRLRGSCGNSPRVMMIASDPALHDVNDMYRGLYEGAFRLSGFDVPRLDYVDDRCPELLDDLPECGLVILCGGHVPTENRYFSEIDLRRRLQGFRGTIVGVSAGSMNAADRVYSQPELEGEAADPDYQRYLTGLGLTDINVLPHFLDVRKTKVDGYQVERDLTVTDSKHGAILAITDGSYVYISNVGTPEEERLICGSAWLFKDGRKKRMCYRGFTRKL